MTLRWDGQGTAADALVTLFSEQVTSARDCIGEEARLSDKDVHNARKAIKRARSMLRLLRPALTSEIFERTNSALRDTGQPLSHLRDSRILADCLEKLRKHFGTSAKRLQLQELEASLHNQCVRARRELTTSSARMHELRQTLRAIEVESKEWHLEKDGWKLLASSLRRMYRHARAAYERVREANSDGRLHEWRKQVKHLGYALQVLTPMHPGYLGEITDQASLLSDYLGEDHDLAVLQKYLAGSVVDADEDALDALEQLIRMRRADLQERAFRVGRRLLKTKARRFIKQLKHCYASWEPLEPVTSAESDPRSQKKPDQEREVRLH